MGFAAGLNAGSGLVTKAMENERQQRAEGRLATEWTTDVAQRKTAEKRCGRAVPTTEIANVTAPVTESRRSPHLLPDVGQPATRARRPRRWLPHRGLACGVPADAPGAAPLLTAAHGSCRCRPAGAASTAPACWPPASPLGQAASAHGLSPTSPVAPEPAAAPAAPEMSPEKKFAQSMFNVAKARKDVNGMNAAVEQYHTAERKEIVNDAAKMTDDEAWDYVHQNVNKVGSLPMSIVKEGKGGYRVTAWSEDGGKGASALLDSAQVKKLVAADKMMKKGYGTEGLDLAGSINKDLNAVIKDYNTEANQQVTTGNTATHYANTEAETAQHNRATEANAAANAAVFAPAARHGEIPERRDVPRQGRQHLTSKSSVLSATAPSSRRSSRLVAMASSPPR